MEAQTNLKAPVNSYQENEAADFSLVLGGPLFQLLHKLHLEGDALELLHRRIPSILLTWFPLLILSIFGKSVGSVARISFLHR
jgi:hypothetical protein